MEEHQKEVEKMKCYTILVLIMTIILAGCDQQSERDAIASPTTVGETDLTISQGTVGTIYGLRIGVMNTRGRLGFACDDNRIHKKKRKMPD